MPFARACLAPLTVALLMGTASLLAGCGGSDDASSQDSDVTAKGAVPHIVPKKVHAYLQEHQFGTYHLYFHSARHYFIGGDELRTWLDEQSEPYAELQEGDPDGGIEFLTMHRAMIEHLREKFGSEKVDNDKAYKTFDDVLDGWQTDEAVMKAIDTYATSKSAAKAAFPDAAKRIGDVGSFESEDEFGTFIQTRLRLGEADPYDSFKRNYDRDQSVGAGIHNTMHGWFADSSSPVDVGDPGTNLSNEIFWGIHGWIDAKWRAFEAAHERTEAQQQTYDDLMEKFGLHFQIHSHDVVPADKDNDFAKKTFGEVQCDDLAEGTTVEDCR